MRRLYLLLVAVLALTFSTAAFAANHQVTIDLEEQNDSGVSGTATLTDNGNGTTTVMLKLNGTPQGGSHPAHIHQGRCPEPGKVVFPLENVDGDTGTSQTTVQASLETIMSAEHAINVHLSEKQIGTYVACGNIPTAAEMPASGGGGMANAGAGIPMVGLALVGMVMAAGAVLVARARSI
ncbi:MAG: superoxide dismutase family protein [Chloroflexota bacterium]|nr:superoxide dismutase family protein [Chloroflexota bacterium]